MIINNLSFKSEHCLLAEFFNGSNTFNKLKTQKEKTKKEKHVYVYVTASELYDELLQTYSDEF